MPVKESKGNGKGGRFSTIYITGEMIAAPVNSVILSNTQSSH